MQGLHGDDRAAMPRASARQAARVTRGLSESMSAPKPSAASTATNADWGSVARFTIVGSSQ